MATFDYAGLRDDVDGILDEFGIAAAIRRSSNNSADPWNPGAGTVTQTDSDCVAVFAEIKQSDRARGNETAIGQGVLIKAGGLGVTPSNGDRLVVGSDVYELSEVEPIAPGGVNLLFMARAVA